MTIHLESGTCVSGITRHMINDKIRANDQNHLITQRLLTYPDDNGQSGRAETWATTAAWNGHGYECYFCSKQFGSLQGLNQHLSSPAHEQKIYHCPKCMIKFKLFSGLVQHVESESCGISRFQEVKSAMDRLTSSFPRMLTV
ncbi:hypothetical protein MMC26_002993 [Xylographa opegraphella]|nr:hypothetical protein [Xylographa opegraphella]